MKSNIQIAFGKVLRKYRIQQQLSQEKLAELADVDRTYVSQIERGLKSPSITSIISLAKSLHVKAYVLVSEMEDELDTTE